MKTYSPVYLKLVRLALPKAKALTILFPIFVLVFMLAFIDKANATSVNVKWALTTNGSASPNDGSVVGTTIAKGSSIGTLSYDGTKGVYSPTGWTTSSSLSSTAYYEYSISPANGYSLTVTGIAFTGNYNGSVNLYCDAYYSLNGFSDGFTSATEITPSPSTISENTATSMSSSFSRVVSNGNTLTVRVYGYYADQAGDNFYNESMVISGTTTAVCSTGTWTYGASTTAWSTTTNWCGSTAPTGATDITIPASLGGYPVIANGVTGACRTITDMAGGSIGATGTGSLSIAGNGGVAITNISGSGVTISCPVAMPTGATSSITVAGSLTMSGIVSGTGVAITKAGTGTLTLSGANSYTGLTTISAGTLQLGATGGATNTPLGTTTTGTTVSNNAALDLAGYTLGATEALTLNGTGISSGGALLNSGGAATYSGLITLGSASSIIGGTGTIDISNA